MIGIMNTGCRGSAATRSGLYTDEMVEAAGLAITWAITARHWRRVRESRRALRRRRIPRRRPRMLENNNKEIPLNEKFVARS